MIPRDVLRPRLAVAGLIKIGGLSGTERTARSGRKWRPPEKWDHIRLMLPERGPDGRYREHPAHREYNAAKRRDLPVFLAGSPREAYADGLALYDSTQCRCRSAAQEGWAERRLKSGRLQRVKCPCQFLDGVEAPGGKGGLLQCRPWCELRLWLQDQPTVGGCYVFRSHGWSTAAQLRGSLGTIGAQTRGWFLGVPLVLRLTPRSARPQGVRGQVTVYTVHLEYAGSPASLLEAAVTERRRLLDAGTAMRELESVLLPPPGDPLEATAEEQAAEAAEYAPEAPEPEAAEAILAQEEAAPRTRTEPAGEETAATEPAEVGQPELFDDEEGP